MRGRWSAVGGMAVVVRQAFPPLLGDTIVLVGGDQEPVLSLGPGEDSWTEHPAPGVHLHRVAWTGRDVVAWDGDELVVVEV